MHWNTHVVRADPKQPALIAVHCLIDNKPYLLEELYVWDEGHACWISERCGLKLKHQAYWWLPETDLLETLPNG